MTPPAAPPDHGELNLAQTLPRFLRRILVVGEPPEPYRSLLPTLGAAVEERRQLPDGSAASRGETFDAVLYDTQGSGPHDIASAVATLRGFLGPYGLLYVLARDRPSQELAEVRALVEREDLSFYELVEQPTGQDTVDGAIVIVSNSYDPLMHAREVAATGDPRLGVEVLASLPRELLLGNKDMRAIVAVEKQRYRLAWQKGDGAAAPPPGEFFQAQMEFYISVYFVPTYAAGYRQQAEFWTLLGNNGMAARLLRSIQHVNPDPATEQMLQTIDVRADLPRASDVPPLWTGGSQALRILVITHPHSDFGMDSLYDGLCTVLGAEHVTEFPWKACLHGQSPEDAGAYPCIFDHPGTPMATGSLLEALRAGQFNLILFADLIEWDKAEIVRSLLAAAPEVPVVVYDSWDDCTNQQGRCTHYFGGRQPDLYFKREMLAGVDYGENALPLPFSYPAGRVPPDVSGARSRAVFWAGNRMFGLRTLYTECLASVRGMEVERKYTPDEFKLALADSRIGLDFFGLGFDTVRYWELPAHGCLLLAERRPIRIPHDYEDGTSAVFFDDLPDLLEKLAYYDARPDRVAEIAAAGHEHFKRFHTNTARAEQFLGWVEARVECPAVT